MKYIVHQTQQTSPWLPRTSLEAIKRGWVATLVTPPEKLEYTSPVLIRFDQTGGGAHVLFEMPYGATPFCPPEMWPVAVIFAKKWPMRLRKTIPSNAPSVPVKVIVEVPENLGGGSLEIGCRYGETPYYRPDYFREGKTARDHKSQTRGKNPTGHSAVKGPAKGPGGGGGNQQHHNKNKEGKKNKKK